MEDPLNVIIIFSIFLMSIVTHEVAHGYVAYLLGDDTAYLKGRLSFNPIKHIDPTWSIMMPLVFYYTVGMPFGGAKPVPVNPARFRNMRQGFMLTSLAGPGSNVLLAIMFTIILSLSYVTYGTSNYLEVPTAPYLQLGIIINLILAFFNMMPIPPLDGSRVLAGIVDRKTAHKIYALEPYGMMMLIGVIFVLPRMGMPVVSYVFDLAELSTLNLVKLAEMPLQLMQ